MSDKQLVTLRFSLMLAVSTLCGTGCASFLQSSGESSTAEKGQGLAYYLPMRLARLTFERANTPSQLAAQNGVAAAKSALATAKSALAVADAAKSSAENLLSLYETRGIARSAQIYLDAAQKAGLAIEQFKAASKQADAATKGLAAAEATLAASNIAGGQPFIDRFAVTLMPYVADTTQRYVLRTRHLATRNETSTLKTTKAGLLTNVDSEVIDKTQEILVSLAKSFVAVAGGPAPINAPPPRSAGGTADCVEREVSVEQIVDLADRKQLAAFSKAVNDATCAGKATATGQPQFYTVDVVATDSTILDKTKATASAKTFSADGVLYRRELPYIVTISTQEIDPASDATPTKLTIAQVAVELPNAAPTEVLTMKASAFGHVKRKLELDNGILLSLDTSEESELAQAAAVPFEVVKATFGAVSELVQLKLNVTTGEKSLTEEQTALAKAQLDLDEAVKKLADAKKAAAEAEADEPADDAP